MCGICGMVGRRGALEVVEAMNARLAHRGPDDHGSFHDSGMALGISRLAILDVDGGNQPIFSENEDVVAVHNGEIYNFKALRDELMSRGHRFRSSTDSEVLVHGYEEWGVDLLQRLKGMFAFCIWDRRARRLLLARDRFGEKPLFYHHVPGGVFAFSSELASLLAFRDIPRTADREALGYYLRAGFIPEPLTGFTQVKSLPPASYLSLQGGQATLGTYFRHDFRPDRALDDDHVAAAACRDALDEAVERQMVSDVPLGAFLSGGIDSSSVVASMVRTASAPVRTFTVRFEDQKYDESGLARRTAQWLGTDHHEIVVPNAAFSTDDLWRIVDHVGQPFYDSSAIPTYVLCKHVRQHVTVALTGDGGDEMFAGYPFFWWGLAVRRLGWLPDSVLAAGAAATRHLASAKLFRNRGALRQIRRAVEAASAEEHVMPARVLSIFDPEQLASLVVDTEVRKAGRGDLPLMTELPEEAREWSPLRRLMYYRIKNNLPRDMLTKIDSMSMACSLELRAPMLDAAVADLAARLPERQLLRAGRGKQVLRRAMKSRLPPELFEAPKSGFSVPLHHYMNDEFHMVAEELLGDLQGDLFSGDELARIRQCAKEVRGDRADVSVFRASHQLWSIVVLAAWIRRFEVAL